MERYNPPHTSQQGYCYGCHRQIRKVQETMDLLYMEKMSGAIQRAKLEDVIQKLQAQLELQEKLGSLSLGECSSSNSKGLETPESPESSSEGAECSASPQTIENLRELNEKLIGMLQKQATVPKEHPLEEWKAAIDFKWEERYEKLRSMAMGLAEKKERLEELTMEQEWELNEFKKEVEQLKKLVAEKDEEIGELKKKLED